jgi:hypothetical protein
MQLVAPDENIPWITPVETPVQILAHLGSKFFPLLMPMVKDTPSTSDQSSKFKHRGPGQRKH